MSTKQSAYTQLEDHLISIDRALANSPAYANDPNIWEAVKGLAELVEYILRRIPGDE